MKTLKYLFIVLCLPFLTGCFKDETTVDTVRISEISIDTLRMQKIYNIDQNEELLISTEGLVSQSEHQLPLAYEWEVNYKFYSDSSALRFVSNELGSFPARLKISNEHGSSFYEFTLNVNSAYEKGIAILSADSDGKPMLSIMRELSDKEVADGKKRFFNTNCLEVTNPDVEFPRYPTDFGQRDKQLFISFKGQPSVYALNSQMLNVENIISDGNPDFIPERILVADNGAKASPVLSESNKIYKMATLEGLVVNYGALMTSTYDKNIVLSKGTLYQTYYIFWDTQEETIVDFNDYYEDKASNEGLDFTGHTPIALYERDEDYFTMITRKDGIFMKTSIAYEWFIWDSDYTEQSFGLSDNQVVINGTPELTSESPYVSNTTYQCLYYASGNKIYRWYYNTATSFPTEPWRILDDLEGAEITSLAVSPDDQQLYVGVCQSSASGLNGSFYLLNCDSGKNEGESPYLNVAYKPLKIVHKPR
ncbi:MAG: hypothetical protein K2I90_00670 [Odoribacter sp.]|nr:hypothetical protein [Odoribacter sp.]